MPGLADMHVHLARDDDADPDALVVFLAAGVTTVRNMWGHPVHLEWRKRINDGDLLGPNIYSTGPITDGHPPFWAGSTVVKTPEEAAEAVVQQKQAGYDGMKVFTNLSPQLYNAILDAAKEHDFPVYGHVPIRVGLENALTRGQRSFEHMVDFTYGLLPDDSPVLAQLVDMWADKSKRNWRGFFLDPREQADRSKIPDLAAKTAVAGVWICPTLAALRYTTVDAAEFERLRSDPTMRYVPPQKLSGWEKRARFLTTDERNDPAIMKRGFETMLLAVKALHDAGARLVVGTDTANPWVVPGFSIHKELAHFVDAGFTPYEAIKAATRDAAEFVDALDDFGTVAAGRRADLLLLEENPLEDVGNAARPVGVMLRGRWYSQADLQPKLDALAEKYAKLKAEGEATVAIENVNVVPMDREAVLPDQTVMVRDGKIASISPASEAKVPALATRIDGTGKYLMPGLADMHVHVWYEDELPKFIAHGVTTVRNMHGGPQNIDWKKRIAGGEFLAPFIYTTGPVIDGFQAPFPDDTVVATSPETARQAVIDHENAGYDFIKARVGLSHATYDAIIGEAAKQGMAVVGHMPVSVGLEYAVNAGQHSIEHMDGIAIAALKGDSPLSARNDSMVKHEAWRDLDRDKLQTVAQTLAKKRTWVCPTLVSMQSVPMPEKLNASFGAPRFGLYALTRFKCGNRSHRPQRGSRSSETAFWDASKPK